MRYETTRFDIVDVTPEQIITFPQGLPGFGELRKFFLVPVPENKCFAWLQSADRPEVAFLVTDPFLVCPQYKVHLPLAEMELLQVKRPEDVSLHVIVRIPADGKAEDITANLVAPVVINAASCLGCQLVLEGSVHAIREPLFRSSHASSEREEGC